MAWNLKSLKKTLVDFIWAPRPKAVTRTQRGAITSLRIGHLVVRDLTDGQLTLSAMGLVYTTLLAIVPLVAVSFSVLKGFGVHNQVEPILLNFLAPLGERGVEVTSRIIEFVDNVKVGVLGALGLALLFYTGVSLIQKIERTFNYIWRVTEHRPLAQRFSDYLTVILFGPVLVFTAIGLTASISSVTVVQRLMEIPAIGALLEFFGRLLPYLLVIAAFTLVYIFVPNTKVKFRSALVGGVVAGILWETTGWIFASFVVGSAKYAAIYSAFATLIFFMIWLYVSWLILLIGCSIAFYYQHPEHRNLRSRVLRLSNRLKEKMALLIMTLVGQHFYQQQTPWNVDTLAKKLHVGVDACQLLVAALQKAGMLVPTASEPHGLLPGRALETLYVKDIINAVRSSGETNDLSIESLPQYQTIDALYTELQDVVERTIGDRTLRDLIMPETSNVAVISPTRDSRESD